MQFGFVGVSGSQRDRNILRVILSAREGPTQGRVTGLGFTGIVKSRMGMIRGFSSETF